MPKKYYCEYCDVFLKNSSRVTRFEHNNGRTHLANKIAYYQKVIAEIDYKAMVNMLIQKKQESSVQNLTNLNSK